MHVSMGNDALTEVAALPHRKAVVYHNITPARFFEGISDQLVRHSQLGREQLRALASRADQGIADSEFNRKELEELGYQHTAVVPILTDAAQFDVEPDPAVAADLASGVTSILVVGQILPQKAIHDVLDAFARYRDSDPSARLFLVGPHGMSGPYLERVREQMARLGLDGSARLTGSVPVEQLAAYYKGATVLLTLSDHEGFNVPLLEAWRCGLPIVANAAGATPETLGDGGILLERKSPDDVAAALERVVRDADLRRDLIAKGRARLASFAPARVAERLEKAFEAVDWHMPPAKHRRVAVLSSDQRCGIHSYSLALCAGLRRNGQDVTFVGVRHLDSADLASKVSHIAFGEPVIIEHEAGIFRDIPFVLALLRLRTSGHDIVFAPHELEPEKF
ncbi:MAG TPA: glycosyltransferase, partial [Gaiellaceae bacterium]|nr:glycosyltransferase [Gaiellaceae bacterium]